MPWLARITFKLSENRHLWLIVCAVSLLIGFGVGASVFVKGIGGWLALLLAAPPAVQLFILVALLLDVKYWHHRSTKYAPGLYTLFLTVGILASYLMLYLFTLRNGSNASGSGVAADMVAATTITAGEHAWLFPIGLAGVLTVMALYITSVLVPARLPRSESLTKFAEELSSHSFKNVFFFFASYLCVAYLAGIALAYHDQWYIQSTKSREQALQGVWIPTASSLSTEAPSGPTSAPSASNVPAAPPNSDERGCYRIYFLKSSFSLDDGATISSGHTLKSLKPPGMQWKEMRAATNSETFTMLSTKMEGIPKNQRIEMILTGHAKNEAPAGNAFRSDSELALLRAQQVSKSLRERLSSWNNIDFHPSSTPYEAALIGISNNDKRLCKPHTKQVSGTQKPISVYVASKLDIDEGDPLLKSSFDEWQSVDILITVHAEHPSRQLLDDAAEKTGVNAAQHEKRVEPHALLTYIHFAVTGHDLVAVTPEARFIAIFANVQSVAFLVIILASLIASCYAPSVSRAPGKGD